jgi:NAD(P)-dependent dehydrogenase (short-subunit alcohol dehydrogenase family)
MAADRNLEGKVAIVTGASQGLGEAIAYLLADRGAKIVVTDIQTQAGEAVAKKISARGADAVFLGHDVAEETRWEAVVSRATELFGKVDILVNNAGLIEFAPTEDISVEMFDRLMRVNVRGVFLGCKTVLPAMKLAGGGAIVNMSSMTGIVANDFEQAAYGTTKGAVRQLTKAVARDYVKYNIRVNSVHPGTIASTFVKPMLADPTWAKRLLARTTMGRAGEPEEVATVVAFLASADASYMTGSEVCVDGGVVGS